MMKVVIQLNTLLVFLLLSMIPQSSDAQEFSVKRLDYKKFIAKVWDFNNYPDSIQLISKVPVIIDFYADWCQPCKKMEPIMKELQAKYKGDIQIYKVNVDEEEQLANKFGIRSIPSLLIIPKTEKAFMIQGLTSKEKMETYIEKYFINKK